MSDSRVANIVDGSARTLAHAISQVENDAPDAESLLEAIYSHTGSAYRLGITGPPGAGKSTLVNELTIRYRQADEKVGIITVDPSSPFSGGAILGDRLRMGRHYLDDQVFIRSMATRGNHGGLARRSQEVGDLLDAAGFTIIIFETVGVGQAELDVMQAVDTTLVVLVPESGDDIQLMKAGIIEIADVFAINKADRDGAGQLHHLIDQMLTHKEPAGAWQTPVVETSAARGEGIDDLYQQLQRHHNFLSESGGKEHKRLDREKLRVQDQVASVLAGRFWTPERRIMLDSLLGSASPYQLARDIVMAGTVDGK
ncbi:MAG: methylmalonyl Co-A mutase-associated GTPase MeaB [Candidatus Marinimicrobia bacterium]|nr:methylmalonyl Co-A mutase-associated GTPase MeaB [Candidatus Neomarinimicrobiota bacterium]